MSRKIGVLGLQLKKKENDLDANLLKFISTAQIKKKQFPWIELIFTGELFLQPYGIKNWKEHAITIPNEITDEICELAKKIRCWIIPGSFLEKSDNDFYNTLIVINPDGEIKKKYRKIYPWRPYEDLDYGEDFITFDIPGLGTFGVAICYDLWFPEVFRTLTWMGAEVIIQPSFTHTPDRSAELVLTQAQSIMFQCYVLNVNTISEIGGGESIFVDPEGRILQRAGTEEFALIEIIDLDKVTWIRQHGSFGINQLWKSFRDSKIKGNFPPYHKFAEGRIFDSLGKLKMFKDANSWD